MSKKSGKNVRSRDSVVSNELSRLVRENKEARQKAKGKKVIVKVPKYNSLRTHHAPGKAALKKPRSLTTEQENNDYQKLPLPTRALRSVKKSKLPASEYSGMVTTTLARERRQSNPDLMPPPVEAVLKAKRVTVVKKTKRTPKKETGAVSVLSRGRLAVGRDDEPEAINTLGNVVSLKAIPPKQRLLRALDELTEQLRENNASWRALDLISDLYSLKMLTTRERDRRSNKIHR